MEDSADGGDAVGAGAPAALKPPAAPSRLPGRGEDRARPARRPGAAPVGLSALVGRSPGIVHLRRLLAQVAPYGVHVLLHGASGTGRELVARILHAESPRREGPFIALDCAALSAPLVESELFGHEPGAVPGALVRQEGCIASAHGGVLFLDRIGHLPPVTQAKLLSVLDGRPLRRLGGTEDRAVDVRVVAATPVALEREIRDGRFRPDLFHRLNEFTMHVPPLRDRPEDLPDLVDHFLARLREKLGKPLAGIAPDALEVLRAHHWPGNVRELALVLKRAAVLARDRITLDDLPPGLRAAGPLPAPSQGQRLREAVRAAARVAERALLLRGLDESGGSRAGAARLLGVSRTVLLRKLRQHALDAAPRGAPGPPGRRRLSGAS